jgi:hypothetical protein
MYSICQGGQVADDILAINRKGSGLPIVGVWGVGWWGRMSILISAGAEYSTQNATRNKGFLSLNILI